MSGGWLLLEVKKKLQRGSCTSWKRRLLLGIKKRLRRMNQSQGSKTC